MTNRQTAINRISFKLERTIIQYCKDNNIDIYNYINTVDNKELNNKIGEIIDGSEELQKLTKDINYKLLVKDVIKETKKNIKLNW
jgi:hypothetical protein